MTTEEGTLTIGPRLVPYTIIRRQRKTLEIAVLPDTRVLITAPLHRRHEEISAIIQKRKHWISEQITYFEQFLPQKTERQYVSGETHRYLGNQYRLKILPADEKKILLQNGRMVVHTPIPDSHTTRRILRRWYREKTRQYINTHFDEFFRYFEKQGHIRPQIRIAELRTHWAHMSASGVMTVNPTLIQAARSSIAYVFTHELCHLEVMNHGPVFYNLLERLMPDWKKRKERLERGE